MNSKRHIAYLFSRYPVVSQTFCDSEILALEEMGASIEVGSINPPLNSFRHERHSRLGGEIHYPPGNEILKGLEAQSKANHEWPAELIDKHDRQYGKSFKASTRARNAVYFAKIFKAHGVDHIHIHFANRATHTALFIKAISGISFSFTAHAQDFMVDLGSDELLNELCEEAEFVVAVSDFSRDLLAKTCPKFDSKIHRIYNGIDVQAFPIAPTSRTSGNKAKGRIISIGRLIEFKGFHFLIEACAELKKRGIDHELFIVGEGPWKDRLQSQVEKLGLQDEVVFGGVLTQEQVKAELLKSDLFALACCIDEKGASDILPTVITEAMACGLPIVSTELVGVPEMVTHNSNGLLCKPEDVVSLAKNLEAVLSEPLLQSQLASGARKKAEEVFDYRTTAPQLADLLNFNKNAAKTRQEEIAQKDTMAFLVDTWPPEDPRLSSELNHLLINHSANPIFACRVDPEFTAKKLKDENAKQLESIEFMPDGIVLEAEWRHLPELLPQMEELRNKLGGGIEGEEFFKQARRALYLGKICAKRSISHVHSTRSDSAVCAWIISKIIKGTFSLAIEEKPVYRSIAMLKLLCGEASAASVANSKVREALGDGFGDDLELESIDTSKRIKIGPMKMKMSSRKKTSDRTPIYDAWHEKIKASVRH